MKELSDVTALIVDTGLFLPMATRLATDCKRVLFYNPDQRAFPSIKQGCIGDGFENVERVDDFWPMIKEVDLACFPDCRHTGLQLHLEELGIAVWGSRRGNDFEQRRQFFMKVLQELELDVPKYRVITGLPALTDFLREREDCYIKISHWRGDMETTHWRSWKLDEGWLDWMAVNLGPQLKRLMQFMVFDKIETDLEIGADTYCIDGKWPGIMLSGVEGKDKSYFATVTAREDMPEQLLDIMEAFSPLLEDCRYRNQHSQEVRIQGGKSYFTDFTARGGMPSTASQHKLWANFPEIVWAGANGELIDPEPTAKFSIEAMVTGKGGGHDCWESVTLPKKLEGSIRFSCCCFVDGAYVFPPDELMGCDLGWLVATGDTPQETLDLAKELADELPDGTNADIESLVPIIREIESARKQGIEVADGAKMPEPASVIEE